MQVALRSVRSKTMALESMHRCAALLALLLLNLLSCSFAARIPIVICNPSNGQLQLQADSNCTAWIPGQPPRNASSLDVPRSVLEQFLRSLQSRSTTLTHPYSNALKPMPRDRDESGFPFHMTDSIIGFNFTAYKYSFELPNGKVEDLITEEAHKVHDNIEQNPRLRGRALTERAEFIGPDEEFALVLQPQTSVSMTWGDVENVFPILAAWAEEYEAKECDFDIWRWPGTERKKLLGVGIFVYMA